MRASRSKRAAGVRRGVERRRAGTSARRGGRGACPRLRRRRPCRLRRAGGRCGTACTCWPIMRLRIIQTGMRLRPRMSFAGLAAHLLKTPSCGRDRTTVRSRADSCPATAAACRPGQRVAPAAPLAADVENHAPAGALRLGDGGVDVALGIARWIELRRGIGHGRQRRSWLGAVIAVREHQDARGHRERSGGDHDVVRLRRGTGKSTANARSSMLIVPGVGMNPHGPCEPQDFKSCASASFATPASNGINSLRGVMSAALIRAGRTRSSAIGRLPAELSRSSSSPSASPC